ncbi:MAG: kynureninase [Bacteroidia bacterium]|nr:MAG: kynureninase [Bacteroidia bacterium]
MKTFSLTLADIKNKARELDEQDTLKHFREKFLFPQHNGKNVLYFTGNSLGLQPKQTKDYILQELNDWAQYGVEGHFHAKRPWYSYHEQLTNKMAKIVGALPEEVVMMNQLTSNLHFLMVSFYRPSGKKRKILIEYPAFPSDVYAVQSQVKFHGGNPETDVIMVRSERDDFVVDETKILDAIATYKDEIALLLIGGVNYLSGQVFDIANITSFAHKYNIICGWDLAHAAGNVELKLHDWDVDFAAWCSYKYLNSGPGSVGGAFIHQKHLNNFDLPIFAGWWGTDKKERFKMKPVFEPMPTAERWQVSNAPILSMAACLASLDIFEEATMPALIQKSKQLTAFLEEALLTVNNIYGKEIFKVITPAQRGAQLSIVCNLEHPKKFFNELIQNGVIADWREPNVIRMAPVPLYNSFNDIAQLAEKLRYIIDQNNFIF